MASTVTPISFTTISDILTRRAVMMAELPPKFIRTWALYNETSNVVIDSGGRGILAPVTTAPAHSTSAAVPTYIAPTFKGLTFEWKKGYARCEIEGLANAVASHDIQAGRIGISNLLGQLDATQEDYRRYCNRVIYGIGNGQLATVGTAVTAAGATIHVKPHLCNSTWYPEDGYKYFHENQLVDICDSAGTEKYGDLKVTKAWYDASAGKSYVTFAENVNNLVNTDIIYHANCKDAENVGLCGQVDDATYLATYGTLARADYTYLKSYKYDKADNSNAQITLSRGLLLNLFGNAKAHGVKKINRIICEHRALTKYALLTTDISRVFDRGRDVKADVGYSGFVFTCPDGYEIPIITDPYCPSGHMFFVDTDHLFIHYVKKFTWAPGNKEYGGIFENVINTADTDKLKATGYSYSAIFTNAPNAHYVIRDINLTL